MRGSRLWRVTLGAALVLGSSAPVARGEPETAPTPVVTLDALPLGIATADLPEGARADAESVLARALFAQRVTGIRYRSREAVFRFLLDHPDFAASIVRALRLGEYRVVPTEDGFWGDDNRGATGTIRILHADEGRRLYHLQGRYETRLLPALQGRLLVLLEFRHETDAEGVSVVESSLTGHLALDSLAAGAIAQTVGALARPLVERAVERKVHRFFRTVARVSRWAYDQPDQLAVFLDGHPEIPASPALAAFRALLLEGHPPAWAGSDFGFPAFSRALGPGAASP